MSLESAKQFLNLLKEDEALQKRMAELTAEEGLAAAKELGLDFTLEELKEAAAEKNDLPVEEMEKIAGGATNAVTHYDGNCPQSPTGGDHLWQEKGVFTEYLIIKHHVKQCAYCGQTWDNVLPW